MHFYVPDDVAESVRRRAAQRPIPVFRYLEELVKKEVATDWPEDYAKTMFGGWQGEPLERAEQGELEQRMDRSQRPDDSRYCPPQ